MSSGSRGATVALLWHASLAEARYLRNNWCVRSRPGARLPAQ
jgi:hypothetical protein